jgi:hypothetical protein
MKARELIRLLESKRMAELLSSVGLPVGVPLRVQKN